MFKYNRQEIKLLAMENNFIANNVEKVLRLCDVLDFINENKISQYLALKGGTAINLFLLGLERLSIDIDFDFLINLTKDNLVLIRNDIKNTITGFMLNEGYFLSDKSKFTHSLDSFVFSYNTTSNSKDILKIEINYSNRVHILNVKNDSILIELNRRVCINRLDDYELIGSKINALILRTTPRDVYDVYKLLNRFNLEMPYIRKVVIFYLSLGSDIPLNMDLLFLRFYEKIRLINYNKLRETLIPVLHRSEKIDIVEMVDEVIKFVKLIFELGNDEKNYINNFNDGNYRPDILFLGYKINDLSNHPMALWKIKNI